MKKLNLLLTSLLFSSLLIGCGMKGPLYRVPEEQPIKETIITPESEPIEQDATALAEK